MAQLKRLLALLIFVWPGYVGAQFHIQLLDQNHEPVSGAIISVPGVAKAGGADQVAVMDQIDRQFVPHVLVVQQGQHVSFPNNDNIRHHVYSFSEPKPFEIKLYRGTPTHPDLFDKPGVVILGCNIHDHMVGYIYVTGEEKSAVTDKNGIAVFDTDLPETVRVWHARLSKSADQIMSMPLESQRDDGMWQLTADLFPPVVKEPRKFKARFE